MTFKFVTLLLSLLIMVTVAEAENFISFSSYREFCNYAVKIETIKAITELNRAMSEVTLYHGKINLTNAPAKKVAGDLFREDYCYEKTAFILSYDGLTLKNYCFSSSEYEDKDDEQLAEHTLKQLPKSYLQRGLIEGNPMIRNFILQYLSTSESPRPYKSIARALITEDYECLFEDYIKLLNKDLKLKISPEKMDRLLTRAETLREKSRALFIAVMFSDVKAKAPIETLVHQFDRDYPINYFVKLFKSYPPSLLETFTEPFLEGYGDKQGRILEVFINFRDRPEIMKALYLALKSRGKGHFERFYGDVIEAWEKITGIKFTGSIDPYVKWYRENIN